MTRVGWILILATAAQERGDLAQVQKIVRKLGGTARVPGVLLPRPHGDLGIYEDRRRRDQVISRAAFFRPPSLAT